MPNATAGVNLVHAAPDSPNRAAAWRSPPLGAGHPHAHEPPRLVERARIVLASADGAAGHAICAQLSVSRPTVSRGLDRYEADGLAGLRANRPRAGRPKQITVADEAAIVERTLHTWRAHGLQPHRVRRFKLSTDPHLVEKLRDVVGLYVNPPERAVVFSFDEKSQIRALDRTQPGLPLEKGRAGTMTHDYKRHRTTTLFAALDLKSGIIHQQCLPQHRHQEFLAFRRRLVSTVPKDLEIHVIFDNYATLRHAAVQRWLKRHERVHFHFTPTSASRRNLIERFFGELTERQLRRLAVTSVEQLIAAITPYIDQRNEQPKPFVWTASVRRILTKVAKGDATLATLQ